MTLDDIPIVGRRGRERRQADEARQVARTTESVAPRFQPVRTDLWCHDCCKQFVALLDYSIEGNHIIECAHCGHPHYRLIVNGRVKGDRWSSGYQDVKVDGRSVWKADSLPMRTTSAAEFIRQRWLDRDS